MNHAQEWLAQADAARSPGELAKLIRKLRWIGLDEEARMLQQAVNTLPPEDRGSVLSAHLSTD